VGVRDDRPSASVRARRGRYTIDPARNDRPAQYLTEKRYNLGQIPPTTGEPFNTGGVRLEDAAAMVREAVGLSRQANADALAAAHLSAAYGGLQAAASQLDAGCDGFAFSAQEPLPA
jgi:hypothetical protein